MKIAEALVLRKHIAQKVEQLKSVKIQGENGMLDVKFNRQSIGQGSSQTVDEIVAQVPKVSMKEITKEYDLYSKALRQLDTSIQQANWAYDVTFKCPEEISV